jgi:hypothetical protein
VRCGLYHCILQYVCYRSISIDRLKHGIVTESALFYFSAELKITFVQPTDNLTKCLVEFSRDFLGYVADTVWSALSKSIRRSSSVTRRRRMSVGNTYRPIGLLLKSATWRHLQNLILSGSSVRSASNSKKRSHLHRRNAISTGSRAT